MTKMEHSSHGLLREPPHNLKRMTNLIKPRKRPSPATDLKRGTQKSNKGKLHALSDEELNKKIEEIESRVNDNSLVPYNTGLINNQNKVQMTKDEHVLVRKERMDNNWSSTIKNLSSKTKRPVDESIINKVDQYREKVEKLMALELATPSDVKYGAQNWYMSLRTSPYFKDLRHYMQPIGNTINGLYLRITDNPNARADIVRKPCILPKIEKKTFKDNPYFKEKMKRESKKIGEIMSGKDDEVDSLVVRY
jgi:hypothetical protein